MASVLQVLLVGVAVVTVTLVHWFYKFRVRRRRLYEMADKLPGPPHLPGVGILPRFMGDTEDIMTTLKEISYLGTHQGGVIKFWIGHKLFCMPTDPVDIDYALKTCLEKDEVTHFFRKILGNGTVFAPVPIWRKRRKVLAPAFSVKSLGMLVDLFSEKSQILTQQLEKQLGTGTFDLWPFYSSYTLDSIFETVLGINTKAHSGDYLRVLVAMSRLLRLVSERLFHMWIQPDWLFRLTPSYRIYKESTNCAHTFTDDAIQKTKQQFQDEASKKPQPAQSYEDEPLQRKSFLGFLIAQSKLGVPYTDLELREEVLSLGVAGTDTSATGSCFTLLMLAKHQDVQDKVYRELLDVFGASERPLVKEDLPKLCYLEQVVKESLRLYPPVPIISRAAEKDVVLPSGTILPAGCGIPISIWGIHRNPKYWGADAELFQPDRFSPERYNPEHPCVYMPFSIGNRNCLGGQYAMMSMKTSLSTILRKHRVRVPNGTSGNIRIKYEITMKAAEGYNILLEKRE